MLPHRESSFCAAVELFHRGTGPGAQVQYPDATVGTDGDTIILAHGSLVHLDHSGWGPL